MTSFDPSAVKLQNLIPLPNLGPATQTTNNYVNPFPSNRITPIPSLKVDHSISSKFKISGYWSTTSTEVQYAPARICSLRRFPGHDHGYARHVYLFADLSRATWTTR